MFAVIKNGGRQFKVSVGEQLEVNRLPVEDGTQLTIKEVLLISDEDRTLIGTPFVENAAVLATVVRKARGEKLIVFRYKAKKRFRHRRGHRQELTILSIDDIVADGKSLITGEAPRAKETPAQDEQDELATPASTTSTDETSTTDTGDVDTDAGQRPARRRRVVRADESESDTEE
ncbi:MAG TPA: 50S ribosomal protein L21 [Ktedonobacteraceae bacterium]|nr:50S ribosomal protein L21 [Ktedonobacteraceae bacterium]